MLLDKLPTSANCKRLKVEWFFVTLGLLLSGCGTPKAQNVTSVEPILVAALPGFSDDDLKGLDGAIENQCKLTNPPAPWPKLCVEFAAQRTDLKAWLIGNFFAWPLISNNGTTVGLITGYYEPLLKGSRYRETDQQIPLYKRPADLQKINGLVQPYYTRADIQNNHVLTGQELIYLDDAIEGFFLEVQGSGRVQLREANGKTTQIRVGFADHNGHAYKAIGQVLIEQKVFTREDISAEKIKQWLRDNPEQARQVMQTNPRFIFFSELPEGNPNLGPKGSLAVPLTAERSIASDPKVVPPGSLMFLSTTLPNDGKPLNRVVLSQDTGAAITGQVRADFFFGFGDAAGSLASAMMQSGRLWLLLPKP
jgi:membrane-bound lytic murein transglycosylase A